MAHSLSNPSPPRSVGIAIVCICSAEHLMRCLDALRAQESAPPFEIVVRYDPSLPGMEAVRLRHPEARIGCADGERTPLELASAALRACTADVLLLTEDHCVPRPTWVRTMVSACTPGRAAVGGRVEIRSDAPAVDWAFYFVDFFRYAEPVQEGPSPSLTVCNVAYERKALQAVRSLWMREFNEPTVHDALRATFGALWLDANSEVIMQRSVAFLPALRERYAFGRIFGHKRLQAASRPRRWLHVAVGPALPALLLARLTSKALRSRCLLRRFTLAAGPLVAMVLSWSWGEWIGYVSGRPPRTLILAADVKPAEDRDENTASI